MVLEWGTSSAIGEPKIPRGYAAAPFNKGAITPGACCNAPLSKPVLSAVEAGADAPKARGGDFFG